MSNTYELSKQIHKLLSQVAEKYGVKIELRTRLYSQYYEIDMVMKIGETQIRQILVALEGVLGENKGYKYFIDRAKRRDPSLLIPFDLPKSQAQVLDDKWFRPIEKRGKYTNQSLFDTNPDQVLTELLEILQNLLKN